MESIWNSYEIALIVFAIGFSGIGLEDCIFWRVVGVYHGMTLSKRMSVFDSIALHQRTRHAL